MEFASFVVSLSGFLLTVYLEWPRIIARLRRNQEVQPSTTEQPTETGPPISRVDITSAQEKSVGFFRSLFALLLGGLVPSWIIATFGVYLVSEGFGGVLFFLVAIPGMIWGVTKLRHKSWKFIALFAGIGASVYVLSIILLLILGFIE